jgi:hypothetical protein
MLPEFMPGSDDFWHEPDFLLADLVSGFVNKGGMELGITLYVRGLVVTGNLVSEAEYLSAISTMFANQAKRSLVNPTRQDLKNADEVFDFTGLAEDVDLTELYGERDDEFDDEEEEEVSQPLPTEFPSEDDRTMPTIRYLHLKDPSIIQPQPAVSFQHNQVSILRLKLTAIDGWMIGKVSLEDDDAMDGYPPPAPKTFRH